MAETPFDAEDREQLSGVLCDLEERAKRLERDVAEHPNRPNLDERKVHAEIARKDAGALARALALIDAQAEEIERLRSEQESSERHFTIALRAAQRAQDRAEAQRDQALEGLRRIASEHDPDCMNPPEACSACRCTAEARSTLERIEGEREGGGR